MEQATISWLQSKIKTERLWRVAAMVGSVLAGGLILYISFWVSYGVLWFISCSFLPVRGEVILLLASGFMAAVVIVGARQNMADLDPLQRQVRMAKDMDITLTPYSRYGMSYNTDAVKAAAFEVRSVAAVINYILCGGVKLVFGAVAQWRRFRRLGTVDVNAAAQVLGLLYAAGKRQSFAEIIEKLPDIDAVKVSYDLRFVDGVLFLSSDPPGLTLHPDLKEEMSKVLPVESEQDPFPRRRRVGVRTTNVQNPEPKSETGNEFGTRMFETTSESALRRKRHSNQ